MSPNAPIRLSWDVASMILISPRLGSLAVMSRLTCHYMRRHVV